MNLEYYQKIFEAPFLQETGQYYRQQASKLVAESSCSEYMHSVVSMLQTARRRSMAFLHQTSVTKVILLIYMYSVYTNIMHMYMNGYYNIQLMVGLFLVRHTVTTGLSWSHCCTWHLRTRNSSACNMFDPYQ